METLKEVISTLKIIGISLAGITFIIFMIKIAIEPEYKAKYLKLIKHLLMSVIFITISLSLVEIPKHYYGSTVEIVGEERSATTIAELKDKDCQGRETININGKWYVVTDTGWTLYNYCGQTNSLAMSHAYQLNIYSTVALRNVDVLRSFSECQGTFKGYFADIVYYRDQDGMIFSRDTTYQQYQALKTSQSNVGVIYEGGGEGSLGGSSGR